MAELRFKFVREESVTDFSHSDTEKLFEQIVQQEGLTMDESKLKHTHPHIVFGLPLGEGLSSFTEYADICLESQPEPTDFLKRMNQHLPKGYSILEAKLKSAKGSIQEQIEAAAYAVYFSLPESLAAEALVEKLMYFLAMDLIIVPKETNQEVEYIDLRSLIMELKLREEEPSLQRQNFVFHMMLRVRKTEYVTPQMVVNAFSAECAIAMQVHRIVRTELFTSFKGKLVSPMDGRILIGGENE